MLFHPLTGALLTDLVRMIHQRGFAEVGPQLFLGKGVKAEVQHVVAVGWCGSVYFQDGIGQVQEYYGTIDAVVVPAILGRVGGGLGTRVDWVFDGVPDGLDHVGDKRGQDGPAC